MGHLEQQQASAAGLLKGDLISSAAKSGSAAGNFAAGHLGRNKQAAVSASYTAVKGATLPRLSNQEGFQDKGDNVLGGSLKEAVGLLKHDSLQHQLAAWQVRAGNSVSCLLYTCWLIVGGATNVHF